MRWQSGTSDRDIEDRRGSSGGRGRIPGGGLGIGGLLLVGILSLVFKQDFFSLLEQAPDGQNVSSDAPAAPISETPEEKERFEFVKFVMNDAQDAWTRILPSSAPVSYERAKLVLFRGVVESACGTGEAASGPFYCPGDQKVYIDLAFYDELRKDFGAAGEFAQAYVIAHEIGHHVQHLLDAEEGIRAAMGRRGRTENAVSVQVELQADCLAGVWASSTSERKLLDAGDVEEALTAASAIGDDNIQKMSGNRVQPDAFTHGSSADRVSAFRRGMAGGTLASCGIAR
jgi:predicted metalloprotease